MSQHVPNRGPGKFRQLRDFRRRMKPSAEMTVYFVEPNPRMDPEAAAELRARLAGVSDWEVRRLNVLPAVGLAAAESPEQN